jgi:hypothetical protein
VTIIASALQCEVLGLGRPDSDSLVKLRSIQTPLTAINADHCASQQRFLVLIKVAASGGLVVPLESSIAPDT